MKRVVWLLILGLLLAGIGCQQAERDPPALVLSGSPAMAPLVRDIADRFMQQRPDVRVTVEMTSSEKGVRDTRQGLADAGMISRTLRPSETGLQAFPLGQDGVALIVHKDNPVQQLSDSQVVGLATRTFTNWKEVGGSDQPVVFLHHAEGRPLRTLFLDRFGIPARQVAPGANIVSSAQAVEAVAAQPRAVSYASVGVAYRCAKEGKPIRLLPLAGVAATPDNVRNGSYPLVRPLNLITRGAPQGLVRELVDFALSEAVHDLIGKHGFAPAHP